jgi:SAM-dependent methyltransferase
MTVQTDWFDDDAFWEQLAPHMFRPAMMEKAPVEVEDIIKLLSLAPSASILDLPCGPGRHTIEFAKRGFRVTAVDRTRAFLERARSAAREAGVSVEFHHDDMRRFSRPGSFDVALCLFTSIGYFQTRAEEVAALSNYQRNLRPGGALVLELMGKEVLARIHLQRTWSEQNGSILLNEHELLDAWTRVRNRWTVINGAERRTFEFTHWLYSAAELRLLLNEAGFARTEFYADLKQSPYDHTANRLVGVAHKDP